MAVKIDKIPKHSITLEMGEEEKSKIILTQIKDLLDYIDNLIIQIKSADKSYIKVIDNR